MHVFSIFLNDGTNNSLFMTDKKDKKKWSMLWSFLRCSNQNHSLVLSLKKMLLPWDGPITKTSPDIFHLSYMKNISTDIVELYALLLLQFAVSPHA
jgi:hypothetical protein